MPKIIQELFSGDEVDLFYEIVYCVTQYISFLKDAIPFRKF